MLLGDVCAGKSSLVLRFVKDQFVEFQVCHSFSTALTFLVCSYSGVFDQSFCYRNQPLVQLFSHKHYLLTMRLSSLRYGIQQARNGIIAWLQCTTGVLLLLSLSLTLLIKLPTLENLF